MSRSASLAAARRALPVFLFLSGVGVLAGASCAGPSGADATTSIAAVQGAGHRSPLAGRVVTVRGVVTANLDDGFTVQDPVGDGDAATSDALIVRTARSITPGTAVEVTGTVREELPGGRRDNLPVTTLVETTVAVLDEDLGRVEPVVLGRAGRAIPHRVIDDDRLGDFEPAADGIDFYESVESMLVRVDAPFVIDATSRFGEIWVLADGGRDASGRNRRGGVTLTAADANPERIQIDDDLYPEDAPRVQIGDRLEAVVGVVGYDYGNYDVQPLRRPEFARLETRPIVASLRPADGALTVATFNVLNLGGDEDDAAFDARARVIVESLHAPAIVALQEIQDDDGPERSGNPAAAGTFARLIAAIERAGGPRYAFTQIDPVDLTDGGQPGGNIRVGTLHDPARVDFVPRGTAGPDDATAVENAGGVPRLTLNPGRVDPTHPAFDDSRKPLATEFRWRGEPLFVVNVHFSSKGGSTPLFGSVRPPVNGRVEARTQQAARVRALVDDLRAVDPDARIVVLGDFNEFDFEAPMQRLTGDGVLRNLMTTLPPVDRVSYVYQGNSQALDHVLVAGFAGAEIEPVHACSGLLDAASDHDPVLVRLRP